MEDKEKALKDNSILVEELKQTKPLLYYHILKAMDDYTNAIRMQRDEALLKAKVNHELFKLSELDIKEAQSHLRPLFLYMRHDYNMLDEHWMHEFILARAYLNAIEVVNK